MARIIEIPTHTDKRGSLTVLEKMLPFAVKRLYWIYDLDPTLSRGAHRHKVTQQAMICMQGSCDVKVIKHNQEQIFRLDKPNHVLILEPEDWHEMSHFQDKVILLLMASHDYDANDYIKEPLI